MIIKCHAAAWRLRVGAIGRRGDVPEASAVPCRSSCRQRPQDMAPLWLYAHSTGRGHQPSTWPPYTLLQGKRSCKRKSRYFIKEYIYLACRDDKAAQRSAAEAVAPDDDSLQDHRHTPPTVDLYMQISKRTWESRMVGIHARFTGDKTHQQKTELPHRRRLSMDASLWQGI